jgi:hypothetical protein
VEVSEQDGLPEVAALIDEAAPPFLGLGTGSLKINRPAVRKERRGEHQEGDKKALLTNESSQRPQHDTPSLGEPARPGTTLPISEPSVDTALARRTTVGP